MPTPLRRVLRRECAGYWALRLYSFGLNEVGAGGVETFSRRLKVETRSGVHKWMRGGVLVPRPRIVIARSLPRRDRFTKRSLVKAP
jgi:hypothetical protein